MLNNLYYCVKNIGYFQDSIRDLKQPIEKSAQIALCLATSRRSR